MKAITITTSLLMLVSCAVLDYQPIVTSNGDPNASRIPQDLEECHQMAKTSAVNSSASYGQPSINERFKAAYDNCMAGRGHKLAQALTNTSRSVQAEQLDVAGVKTGMSKAEAISAVTKKLRVDKKAVQFEKDPQSNPVTNTKEPKYFTVKDGLSTVNVYFEPSVPPNKKRPMVVSTVIYEQPWTTDNAASMGKAAVEKYGQPSNGTIGVSWQWCNNPDINPGVGCHEQKGQGVVLELAGTKLELTDNRYTNARIEFMTKKQNAKPNF